MTDDQVIARIRHDILSISKGFELLNSSLVEVKKNNSDLTEDIEDFEIHLKEKVDSIVSRLGKLNKKE